MAVLAVSAVATVSPVAMICGAAAAAHNVGVARLRAAQAAAIGPLAGPDTALASSGQGAAPRSTGPHTPDEGGAAPGRVTTTGTAPSPAPTTVPPTTSPAPAPTTTTSPAQMVINTSHDFAVALLETLGDTVTSQNTLAIVSWAQAEGGAWNSPAKYNPLNTTRRMSGSYSINGVGVQSYTSWPEGLAATAQTLQAGAYGGILSALKAGSSGLAVERAVASSVWGTGSFPLLS
ncbi:MAG TPA: hypothetical protein VGF64_08655 [Acidimicrobiales bacterium]